MKFRIVVIGVCSLFLAFSFLRKESRAHEWMAPGNAAEIKNPIALDKASVEKGKQLYTPLGTGNKTG